jgi:hypothetical protein
LQFVPPWPAGIFCRVIHGDRGEALPSALWIDPDRPQGRVGLFFHAVEEEGVITTEDTPKPLVHWKVLELLRDSRASYTRSADDCHAGMP